jgi:subtilisin family serine protease
MHTATRLLAAFAVLAPLALGCGPDETASDVTATSGAVTAAQASFLVSFAGGRIPANADSVVGAAGGTIVARYPSLGAVLARSSSPAFAASLRGSAGVDSVGATAKIQSALRLVTASAPARSPRPVPPAAGDPLSARQWDMDQIHAPQARSISAGKKSVRVGVLDTGIDVTHPDMAGQVNTAISVSCVGGVPSTSPADWANDVFGHGTHVAGIIGAAKNGIGIVGVAPGVQLGAIKVVDDNGLIFPEAFVCGMDWAAGHDFDVLNASFTVDPFFFYCTDDPDQLAIIKIVRSAVLAAGRKKVTLVAATGNAFLDLASLTDGTPGAKCKVLPVQLPRVIGVSAVGFTQKLAFYSDYGFGAVDVTAPGGDQFIPDPVGIGQVLSCMPENSLFFQAAASYNGQVFDCSSGTCVPYAYIQGTSSASPHAAGVAALAVSRFGSLPPEALLAVLSLTATPLACPPSPYDPDPTDFPNPATCVGPPRFNNFYGAGEVDALAVVR